MLSKNLINYRRVSVAGILALTLLTNVIPGGLALGEGAFTILLLLVVTYLFEVTFYGIKK